MISGIRRLRLCLGIDELYGIAVLMVRSTGKLSGSIVA